MLQGDALVAANGTRHALAGAKLLPPVIPGNFYAAGLNFRAHIEWANQHLNSVYKVPEQADIGYRSNNALIGSGADIVIPADSPGPIEFEGELVAVIGRQTKHVSEEGALDCVAGYTLGNTPQPHNEGDFTALGRVVRGMDVVDRLELGDAITGARMLQPAK